MADERKDGGPAFPFPNPNYDGNWDNNPVRGGMTLRDWFAGQAMNGLITRDGLGQFKQDYERLTDRSYEVADTMLTARQKGGDVS